MSDWADIKLYPVISIDFLWKERPTAYCLNCSGILASPQARSHWGGCGIVFKYVTTRAFDETYKRMAREMRPDLEWRNDGADAPPQEGIEFLKDQPVRPLFAWERGEPRGEGSAGEYVRHLRDRRRTGHTRTGMALDFGPIHRPGETDLAAMARLVKRFSLRSRSGLKPVALKYLEPKETPMRLDITVQASDLASLVQGIMDIADSGLEVVSVRNVPEPAPTPRPILSSDTLLLARYVATDTASITRYLQKVCDHNAPLESGQAEVEVEYVAQGTEERSTRTVQPIDIRDNYLVLLDRGTVKTFLLDRIQQVEGPDPTRL